MIWDRAVGDAGGRGSGLRSGVCLALLALAGAAFAQERAFVEVTAEKDAYYAGETMLLKLRFGYDRDFFRTNSVPLFAREMEVPVQVQAQLPGWPGVIDLNDPRRGPRFAMNDGVVKASSASEETREGRVFTVVETRWKHRAPEPGDLSIAAPTLRYAYATEFEEDFVSGRVAKDPKQEVVNGAPLKLRILPLPEGGRPREFRGLVGRFTVSAEASRTSLKVGEGLELVLTMSGDGASLGPEVELPLFHRLGVIRSNVGWGGCSARYHLRVLSADVKEIPAISFAYFDPGPPAGYRVIRTDPIPLDIRGGPAPEPPAPPPARARDPVPFVTAAAAAALAAVAFLLWSRSRRRVAPPDPHRVRLEEALFALRATREGPALADSFAEFLAAYLRCPPAAVIGPDLPARLAAQGMDKGLATRAAATLERLVAARYGGGLGGTEEFAALLPEIEAATVRAGSPR